LFWAISGALAGLLFALLSLAPAYWLSETLRSITHEQVLLLRPSGTVWKGSAQLALSSGPKSQHALGLPTRLEWEIMPMWLGAHDQNMGLFSRLQTDPLTLLLELQAPCCLEQTFSVTLKPDGLGLLITAQSAEIKLPAHWLEGLGAPWNTLQPKGLLSLQNHNFQVLLKSDRVTSMGVLELKIDQLSSRLSTVKPLGSYRVLFNAQSSPQIELSSLAESRLILKGQGQWAGGRLHFEGMADTAPSDEETLSNLLNVLGQRSGHQASLKID
jgi:general secretion pathway protein N